jgi:predicted transcriptional regulator
MEKMSLSFKVEPGLKRALENLAEKENRSLSNYVVTFLMKHLEEKGVEWRKEGGNKANK